MVQRHTDYFDAINMEGDVKMDERHSNEIEAKRVPESDTSESEKTEFGELDESESAVTASPFEDSLSEKLDEATILSQADSTEEDAEKTQPPLNSAQEARNQSDITQELQEQENLVLEMENATPKLEDVLSKLDDITAETRKNAVELRELRKLYHNEYSGRLAPLEAQVSYYRELEKGRIYDGILREIGKLYSDNFSVVDSVDDPKIQKQLKYLFLDMKQLLEEYGVQQQKSEEGTPRNPRYCRVVETVETERPELHNTVKKSHSVGFYVDGRTLVPELVTVYVHSVTSDGSESGSS